MNKEKYPRGKSAQIAIESWMTYGWALLIVVLILGTLAYFGVLSPSNFVASSCSLGTGLICNDFAIQNETVTVALTNGFKKTIHITEIEYKFNTENEDLSHSCFFSGDIVVAAGETIKINTTDPCTYSKKEGKEIIYPEISYYFPASVSSFPKTNDGRIVF